VSHRLFIALSPPEDVRDLLLDAMEGIEGARWIDEANLHLTLRFVGEVETPVAEDLAGRLSGIAAEAFTVELDGVGHFTRKGQAAALWARVLPAPGLEALRQKVERACEAAGLGRETRRFTPHVTLARLGRSNGGRSSGDIGRWLASFGDLRAYWRAEHFTLFESRLGRTGATYEAAATFPLRG
jgi:2'-5' RNA ligase